MPDAARPSPAPVPGTSAESPSTADGFARLALEARARGDWDGCFRAFEAAARLRPRNPVLLYNVAASAARAGRAPEALQALRRLLAMQVAYEPAADSDFAALRTDRGLRGVCDSMRALATRRVDGHGAVAFRLVQTDFIPEGLARGAHGEFFVGSVRHRKIVRVDRTGKATDFTAEDEDSLFEVLGMAADTLRGFLWACSSAGPEMLGSMAELDGRAALHGYCLNNPRLCERLLPPDSAGPHNFNDLTVGPDGTVYVSDPVARCVYRGGHDTGGLGVLVEPGKLVSPQGLAVSRDGRRLFVADYVRGVAVVDLPSRAVRELGCPAGVTLYGLDALARHGDDLIAVQNGVRPHRVVRLTLNAAQDSVTAVRILEMNHPLWDEPTLGAVAGDDFYYVANSHWSRFDREGRLRRPEELSAPVILRLPLR